MWDLTNKFRKDIRHSFHPILPSLVWINFKRVCNFPSQLQQIECNQGYIIKYVFALNLAFVLRVIVCVWVYIFSPQTSSINKCHMLSKTCSTCSRQCYMFNTWGVFSRANTPLDTFHFGVQTDTSFENPDEIHIVCLEGGGGVAVPVWHFDWYNCVIALCEIIMCLNTIMNYYRFLYNL